MVLIYTYFLYRISFISHIGLKIKSMSLHISLILGELQNHLKSRVCNLFNCQNEHCLKRHPAKDDGHDGRHKLICITLFNDVCREQKARNSFFCLPQQLFLDWWLFACNFNLCKSLKPCILCEISVITFCMIAHRSNCFR